MCYQETEDNNVSVPCSSLGDAAEKILNKCDGVTLLKFVAGVMIQQTDAGTQYQVLVGNRNNEGC